MSEAYDELGVVYEDIERPSKEDVATLQTLGVATVHEAMGRVGLMASYMKPIYEGAHIAGPAVTVLLHPGDNWMMHVVAEQIQQGDVVVVAISSPCSDGFFGDLLATSFQAQGAKGLIMDGGVRDTVDLKKMQFPVWTQHISAKGTIKGTLGSVNIPIICGGVSVHPGDVIVADDDGVVVVPLRHVKKTIEASLARDAYEEEKRVKLKSGVLGLDMYEMRDELAKAGLRYIKQKDTKSE